MGNKHFQFPSLQALISIFRLLLFLSSMVTGIRLNSTQYFLQIYFTSLSFLSPLLSSLFLFSVPIGDINILSIFVTHQWGPAAAPLPFSEVQYDFFSFCSWFDIPADTSLNIYLPVLIHCPCISASKTACQVFLLI